MQPVRNIECAQERDSSPVIFGMYEARTRDALDSSVQLKQDAPDTTATTREIPIIKATVAMDPLEVGATRGSLPEVDGAAAPEQFEAAPASGVNGDQERVARVWRSWLETLASDPEAALAAAHAYQQMDATGREEWLRALETDVADLGVPTVAVYAPLLAVESDPHRLRQIMQVLARSRQVAPCTSPRRALHGSWAGRARVAVLVEPLYLSFVQVLACAYIPGERFLWVRHDPIASEVQVSGLSATLECANLEPAPLRLVVDDLAHTILAHRRYGGTLPDALRLFADLFGLDPSLSTQDELPTRWRL